MARVAALALMLVKASWAAETCGQLFIQRATVSERRHMAKSNSTPHALLECPNGAILQTLCMTSEQYDSVAQSVRSLLESLPETCTPSDCPQADFSGCILRMAGHDFMDFAAGQGGSDACTDMLDPDNAGLEACLHSGEFGLSLNQVYQEYCSSVSLADFIVIAAEAVMTSTRERQLAVTPNAPALDFRSQFRFGRTTAESCEFSAGRLPNPERGCGAVEETFVQGMGLSWSEAAALMGVHTLGRAHIANSGYHGWWSDPENSRRFNNNYYVSLVAKGWLPELAVSGNQLKNQWRRSDIGQDTSFDGHEMMLNTDLCLVFAENGRDGGPVLATEHDCCAWLGSNLIAAAIQNNGGEFCGAAPPRGGADAERNQCCEDPAAEDCGNRNEPSGPAAEDILTFASDEGAWIANFLNAWRIATENGFETNLQALTPECQSSSTTTSTTSVSSTTSTIATTAATSATTTASTTTITTIATTATASTTEATTTSATQGDDGFFTVDGSADRVCRGASAGDNLASYYTVRSAVGLENCKALCIDHVSCRGIEFNAASGRCELWHRAGGIGSTSSLEGYVCFGYARAPDDFEVVDGGFDRACRGSAENDNLASHYSVTTATSLSDCKAKCRAESACKGLEFHSGGRCEVWVRPEGIGATAAVNGFTCLRYTASATPSPSSSSTTVTSTTGPQGGGDGRRRRRRRPQD
mmetsp:Transcript_56210/g.100154  ORF Transcript_56210/g.100154 Transcript_56210/m.100154 type:complete len:699 (-) Transcript_56210:343-2439(-)|eukprot:CAMPEP_0197660088 /NCGR_PEP_ID=MMETSP1338-20131121/50381_1 /TAXON_ID=43686 ORGANISM="Pelagodinium beii, Strain RCC1491" /NCGR_SAMPLE_ID=MMETSP1338 /ASSEMBLY_ACC=CAM_ASM_000754 /LENGTH=698 /DNA_ID=CAMNT_0043237335 /DNA_START=55 /DNA_END=2151 /DNA_ORIENTATION=+